MGHTLRDICAVHVSYRICLYNNKFNSLLVLLLGIAMR